MTQTRTQNGDNEGGESDCPNEKFVLKKSVEKKNIQRTRPTDVKDVFTEFFFVSGETSRLQKEWRGRIRVLPSFTGFYGILLTFIELKRFDFVGTREPPTGTAPAGKGKRTKEDRIKKLDKTKR